MRFFGAVQQSHKSCAIATMAALSCQLGQPCVVVVSDVLSSVEEVVSKANSLLRPLDPKFDGLSPVLHFCTGASKTWNFTRMEYRGIKMGGLVPVLQASKAVLKHLNELAESVRCLSTFPVSLSLDSGSFSCLTCLLFCRSTWRAST